MVHIAAWSLSLIVDICQSNKERLEKQFDPQTCFYNATNSQTFLIHLTMSCRMNLCTFQEATD